MTDSSYFSLYFKTNQNWILNFLVVFFFLVKIVIVWSVRNFVHYRIAQCNWCLLLHQVCSASIHNSFHSKNLLNFFPAKQNPLKNYQNKTETWCWQVSFSTFSQWNSCNGPNTSSLINVTIHSTNSWQVCSLKYRFDFHSHLICPFFWKPVLGYAHICFQPGLNIIEISCSLSFTSQLNPKKTDSLLQHDGHVIRKERIRFVLILSYLFYFFCLILIIAKQKWEKNTESLFGSLFSVACSCCWDIHSLTSHHWTSTPHWSPLKTTSPEWQVFSFYSFILFWTSKLDCAN